MFLIALQPSRDLLAATAGAGGMAPPSSTMISARLKRVLERSSRVSMRDVLEQVVQIRLRGYRYESPLLKLGGLRVHTHSSMNPILGRISAGNSYGCGHVQS